MMFKQLLIIILVITWSSAYCNDTIPIFEVEQDFDKVFKSVFGKYQENSSNTHTTENNDTPIKKNNSLRTVLKKLDELNIQK
ncbi:MAG: hypothetical protein IJ848_00845 [Alphaproteobacteria bacterium]|nr:hypothetical protein [Alphaproteobacteria bacterium]